MSSASRDRYPPAGAGMDPDASSQSGTTGSAPSRSPATLARRMKVTCPVAKWSRFAGTTQLTGSFRSRSLCALRSDTPEHRARVLRASVDVTDARNDQAGRQTHRWSVFRSLITGQSVSSNSSPPESISSLRLRTTDNLEKRRTTKLHSTASCDHQIECVPHFTQVCLSAYPTPGAIQPGACRFALAGCARLLSP